MAPMTPVKSSNLKAVGYDSTTKALTVEFNNGAKWRYDDVDAKHHTGLMGADSPGVYFHTHIRGHKATRVGD